MKLTTTANVSVDAMMQGCGGLDEDHRGDRNGWARPSSPGDVAAAIDEPNASRDASCKCTAAAAQRPGRTSR
jgi:hypothetical protein